VATPTPIAHASRMKAYERTEGPGRAETGSSTARLEWPRSGPAGTS
jgi:hypothetical protein